MIKMSEDMISGYGSNVKKILKGSVVSILISIILLIAFSGFLTYSSMSEKVIPVVILIITGISILIGSQMSTVHIRKNGLLNGGSVGLIYILTLYLISSIVGKGFLLNTYSIIMIVVSILMGAVRRNHWCEYEEMNQKKSIRSFFRCA